jgi:cation diffusion facilitator CzcD-associated flavoprotein CzcO
MKTLKSDKNIMGPALNIPHLTFRAWYEAQYGEEGWNQLGRIPTATWMDYLKWYRKVARLPIENNCRLVGITPQGNCLSLLIEKNGENLEVLTRKLVLATGRTGFGGCEFPPFMQNVSKSFYAHTTESIDFDYLTGKRICIVGCGASAFDAAAEALEHKAARVDLLMRRDCFPETSHFGALSLPGFYQGFYQLNDEMRLKFISNTTENGIPPPRDALERVARHKNLYIKTNTTIECVQSQGGHVEVSTNKGSDLYDYVILATGFCIDGCKELALCQFIDQIKKWEDLDFLRDDCRPHLQRVKRFPYLGSHFEFKEKTEGSAPFLKNIYCFNYAAVLSHGHVSDDIEGISVGAIRLAEGIAADFFLENADFFYQPIADIETP